MTPTPEPTIFDITMPHYTISAPLWQAVAIVLGLILLVVLFTLLRAKAPSRNAQRVALFNELEKSLNTSHTDPTQAIVRAIFVATGEDLATMGQRELEDFAGRWPQLKVSAEFLKSRFESLAGVQDRLPAADKQQFLAELKVFLTGRAP